MKHKIRYYELSALSKFVVLVCIGLFPQLLLADKQKKIYEQLENFEQKKVRSPNLKSNESQSFSSGVYKVLIADITLSLDNVLGVAGAAKQLGLFGA
ncbi:MAG: hypothetical protein EBX05_04850 [Rhodobacteraceae bacterium]|nr:hypothetical protein [Paracoccaceae bacterium]